MPDTAPAVRPRLRNVVPRIRRGVRDWTRLDLHERAVLAALYAAPGGAAGDGLTMAEIQMQTGISPGPLDAALRALRNPTRIARLGSAHLAITRTDRTSLAAVYTVTAGWRAAHVGPAR